MKSLAQTATYHNSPPLGEIDAHLISKPKFSAIDKSRRRAKQNFEMGTTLGDIAKVHSDIAAEVTADLLKLSSDEAASGELTNLVDKKGRVYNCPHSLISANTRLDTNYGIKTARRHRKRIYEAFLSRLDEIKEHGLFVSFLTPTFPNLLGVGFADNDRFQSRAWELFLQMKVFDEFFYAGFSKTEWTLGGSGNRAKTGRGFDLETDGINYHSHVLCVNYKEFAYGETSKLESELAFLNKSSEGAKEDKRLLRNSLKIITAWTKCVKKAHWEVFGKRLGVNTKSGRVRFTFQKVSVDEIRVYDLDEAKNSIFWEIAKTVSYTAKGNDFRGLTPELLLEAENVFRNKRIINPFGVFRKHVEMKSATSLTLVNQPTQQTENTPCNSRKWLSDSELRGKNEPLKTYGIRLCEQGKRRAWLKYLKENRDRIIEKRRDALLERFPHAVFTDLSGKSYTIEDCRRKFQLTSLADTDNGAWYSKRIPSRQSPGVLDKLRELERG